jgi:hypothetical protein
VTTPVNSHVTSHTHPSRKAAFTGRIRSSEAAAHGARRAMGHGDSLDYNAATRIVNRTPLFHVAGAIDCCPLFGDELLSSAP